MTRVWKWNRPVTVREVLEDLQQERSIAYTTVMTVLDNLHQKGWVRREAEGRAYRYEAVSTRAAYSAALMNDAWSQSDNPAGAELQVGSIRRAKQIGPHARPLPTRIRFTDDSKPGAAVGVSGALYPEWDVFNNHYRPDWCRVIDFPLGVAADVSAAGVTRDDVLRRRLSRSRLPALQDFQGGQLAGKLDALAAANNTKALHVLTTRRNGMRHEFIKHFANRFGAPEPATFEFFDDEVIRRANLILLMEDGRVTERGTHEQLMNARGVYYDMVKRQMEHDQRDAEVQWT